MNTYTVESKTFQAGEALEAYRRVKLSTGKAVYADAGEDIIGLTMAAAADDGYVKVKLLNDSGTFPVVAADTFSAGAALYGATDGKVSDTVSGNKQFIAIEAATAANQVIEAHAVASFDALSMQSLISDPAAMAALTQDTLTDNGGGTADQTVASMTAPTTITDSTGLDVSHDDEVAAIVNTNELTDNGAGTADQAVEDVADIALDTSNTYTDAAVNGAVNTAIASISNNFKEMTTELALQRTANGVLTQNQSDLSQKLIENITLLGVIQDNFKEVTTELAKVQADLIAAKAGVDANNAAIDSIIDALQANGIVATS